MTRIGAVGDKSRRVLELSTANIEAYEGAVRSSKTITSIIDFATFLRSMPDGEFAIVGRTERTAFRNIVEPMQVMFGPKLVKYNRGLGTLNILNRKGYLLGANNEASRTKLQGLTLAALYLDECATLPESFFNMANSRLSVAGAKMWLTANPEGRNHWLLKNWLERAQLWLHADGTVTVNTDNPIELHRYTYTMDDNPHLTPDYVARMKRSYSGIWYRRFILSEWTNAEGAVYDLWDPTLMTYTVEPRILSYVAGIDHGTTNATVCIVIGLGADGKLYVMDQWRHAPREGEAAWTNAQLSQGVIGFLTRYPMTEWIAVDPAAASFRLQLYTDGVRNVTQADNAVVDGIRDVASLLGLGSLQIHAERCPGLLAGIPEYAWDKKATERGEDAPAKKADDDVDALRYAVRLALATWPGRVITQSPVEVDV